jgi:hypothetical protein
MIRTSVCAGLLFGLVSVCQGQSSFTSGTASLRFTLHTYAGSGTGIYSPKHVVAAWVTDGSDHLVQTVMNSTGSRKNRLSQWYAVTNSGADVRSVNGTSSATIADYSSPTTTVTWNGKDATGNVMADGPYKFWIDFTECNNDASHASSLPANLRPEPYQAFSFTKGASGFVLNPADTQYNGNGTYPITGVQVTFTPVPEPSTLAYLAGGGAIVAWRLRCHRGRSRDARCRLLPRTHRLPQRRGKLVRA